MTEQPPGTKKRRDPKLVAASIVLGFPFLIPAGAYLLAKGCVHGAKTLHQDISRHKKQRRHDRRRRLSDATPHARAITKHDEQQPAFLDKLPLEIRQMIYECYYDSTELTVRKLPQGRFSSRLISFTDFKDSEYAYSPTLRPRWDQGNTSRGLLQLPLTCRQM